MSLAVNFKKIIITLIIFSNSVLAKNLANIDIHFYDKKRTFKFFEKKSEIIKITQVFDGDIRNYVTKKSEFITLLEIVKNSKSQKDLYSCYRKYIKINNKKIVCLDSDDGKKIDNKIRSIIITSTEIK